MKCILVLLVLTLAPLTLGAQQPETDECSFANIVFNDAKVSRCLQIHAQKAKEAEAKSKETAAKLAEANRVADELKRAADDANKVLSADKGTQIEGMTDVVKDMNSHSNNNPASKVVTGKALSVIDRFAQMENGSLNDTGNAIQSGLETHAGSATPYSAEGHVLNESTRANADAGSQPSTIDQRYQQQEQILMVAPSARSAVAESEPTERIVGSQVSVNERFNNQENEILLSPSNVKAVADADRKIQAAEQARRDKEAKEEAARQVEVARQAKVQADEQRLAKIEKDKATAAKYAEIDREYAEMEREERIEAAREARRQQAALNALFGTPPAQAPSSWDTPSYLPGYIPAYVPDVSSSSPSFVPTYTPNSAPSGYSFPTSAHTSPDNPSSESIDCSNKSVTGLIDCMVKTAKANDAALDASVAASHAARVASDAADQAASAAAQPQAPPTPTTAK